MAENPGRADPLDPQWGGLAWSGWHGMDATAARGLVPQEAGVYRLCCGGHVIYVGISDRLSSRLGGLRRARGRPPLFRGHSAAACVADFESRGEVVAVSWALAGDIDRRALMGLEVGGVSCRDCGTGCPGVGRAGLVPGRRSHECEPRETGASCDNSSLAGPGGEWLSLELL